MEEIRKLKPEGLIDPWAFRTAQKTGGRNFRLGSSGEARSVLDTANDLRSGKLKPDNLPPIRIVEHEGKLWTLDHRRVIAARLAGTKVRYVKLQPTRRNINNLKRRVDSPDGGITIRVRLPKGN